MTALRPSEIAKRWGVKHLTVLKLIHANELPAINIAVDPNRAPRWRVPQCEVLRFEQKRLNRRVVSGG